MTTEGQPLRSLQELCEIQLQDNVLKSITADDEFASLEPRFQLLLFRRLRTEHARLSSVKDELEQLLERMPVVDRQLTMGTSANACISAPENDAHRDSYRIIWSYVPSGMRDRHYYAGRDDDYKQWSDRVLRAGLPDTKFIICPHHILAWSCECKLPKVFLCERISSQLLLYRISATFGMPPADECDGYKSRWEASLYHQDGSMASFGDTKGGATVKFRGTHKASDDALNLLNYLVGSTFRPTGDGNVTPSIARDGGGNLPEA